MAQNKEPEKEKVDAKMSALDVSKFKSLFTDERGNLVFLARTAETAERYDDMCRFMRALVEWTDTTKGQTDLTVEERNLLSVAYKNVVGQRRASWRSLQASIGSASDAQNQKTEEKLVQLFQKQVEGELETYCKEALHLLLNILLKNQTAENEARVFYLKMAGDYYRYLAEFTTPPAAASSDKDKDKSTSTSTSTSTTGGTGSQAGGPNGAKAAEMYNKALVIATKTLLPTHPIRLGLALNFSVCFYEILKDKQAAVELAKSAFDQAIARLDKIDESMYKDSTLIMQLIRDNLTLWTAEGGENQEGNIQTTDAGVEPSD